MTGPRGEVRWGRGVREEEARDKKGKERERKRDKRVRSIVRFERKTFDFFGGDIYVFLKKITHEFEDWETHDLVQRPVEPLRTTSSKSSRLY